MQLTVDLNEYISILNVQAKRIIDPRLTIDAWKIKIVIFEILRRGSQKIIYLYAINMDQ